MQTFKKDSLNRLHRTYNVPHVLFSEVLIMVWRTPSLVILLLSLSILGCGGGGGGGGGSSATSTPTNPTTPTITPSPIVPEPPAPQVSQTTLNSLQTTIDNILADSSIAGRTLSAMIVEQQSGQVIYASDPDRVLIPASNTKMVTTAAAMALLGPDHRFLTTILADQSIPASGNLQGNLYIHSEHDFTWATDFYSDPRFVLDQIANRLYEAGLRTVSGSLEVYGAYCFNGDQFASYSPAIHRDRVETQFLQALTDRGITVSQGSNDHATLTLPTGLTTLTTWRSVPLWVACSPINRRSHNEMADILCRHIGFKVNGVSSYSAGSMAILDWLANEGITTTNAVLEDGSGLDTDNRFSARQLVELTRLMQRQSAGPLWNSTLSIAGVVGTLSGRMTGADTNGRVFAKSGTNAGICTSGFLVNKFDGRKYVFSVLMNNLPGGSAAYSDARAVQNRFVEAVSGDLLNLGTRPDTPNLTSVKNLGGFVQANWEQSPGATGYVLQFSQNGRSFASSNRFYTTNTEFIFTAQPGKVYVRVTALNSAGESDVSDTYGTQVTASGTANLLIVDGFDRWQSQPITPENTIGASHAFVVDHGSAIDSVSFDACSNEAILSGAIQLQDYQAVIWLCGEESTVDESFSSAEQTEVSQYLSQGGQIFVSGAEIAWDLARSSASSADKSFYQQFFMSRYVGDDAGTYIASGAANGIFANIPVIEFYTPGAIDVSFPDIIQPESNAIACLNYTGGQGGVAGVQFSGSFKVVNFGFPFESIDGLDRRREVMAAILNFFGF